MQEYIHRLLLLKVFLSPAVVSLAPPASKERERKKKTPSRDAVALTDGFKSDTLQRERTVSVKKRQYLFLRTPAKAQPSTH